MPTAPKPPDPPASDSKPKKRKRRWGRRLLVALAVFLVLGAIAAGPGARWLIHKLAVSQLEKKGMSGDLEVSGHLFTGFTIRDFSFSGTGEFETLRLVEGGVEYSLFELLDKKVDRLHARELQIELTPIPKPKEEKKPFQFDKLSQTLRKIRPLVLPVAIEIENVTAVINKPDGSQLTFDLGALSHEPQSEELHLRGIASNALGDDGLPAQDITITWKDEHISVTRVEVLPSLALASLEADYPIGQPLTIDGLVELAESEFTLAADESGSVQLALQNPPLDLARLTLPGEVELGGRVLSLDANFENLLAKPNDWTGTLAITGEELSWPNGLLAQLDANLEVSEDAATLTASAGPHLVLEARGPHLDLADKGLAKLADGAEIDYELRIDSLHGALATALPAAGQEVPDLETLPEGKLEATGNLVTGGPRGVSNAEAQWTFSDLVYRDNPVPPLAGEATLSGDDLALNLNLQNPGPEEKLLVAARLDLATLAYGGNAEIDFPDTAWLRPLLPLEGEDWKPEGPLTLAWNGNGNLKDANHQGDATVSEVTVTAPGESVVEARLTANYDWPGSVTASELWVRNGLLIFEGAAGLANDRVSITNVRVHDETGDLATVSASVPLPPKGVTLKEYLASDESLTLDFDSNQLRLARLSDLFPLKLPEGLAFALDADLSLTGTPSQPVLDGTLRASELRIPKGDSLPPLTATMDFDTIDNRLSATTTVADAERDLLTFRAALPLEIEAIIDDPEHLFTLPLEASLAIDRFPLDRARSFAPALESLTGTLNTSIEIANTINSPNISGSVTVAQVAGLGPEELPPLDAALELSTEGDVVSAAGKVTEPGGDLLTLSAALPLPVAELRQDPDRFSTLPLQANVRIDSFELKRLSPFAPPLEKAVGRINVDVSAEGPVSEPALSGTAAVELERFPLPDTPYREVQKSNLAIRFEGFDAIIEPSSLTIAGGTIDLSGKVSELTGGDPVFDVRIQARQALLWRNEIASARGNGTFRITGPLSGARVSGELGIVESLAYKDIDIIPMRVPITAAARPQLPQIDTGADPDALPVPPPIGDWTLDLRVRTQDPILLRGNRAKGEINADVQVAGTVAEPRPTGWIQLRAVEAGLPFSTLKVPKGTIYLRPNHPFDPLLDIAGESQVGTYQISLYASGPLSDPKFTVNSFPPLPQSEIMALLATGSTTASLQDTELAQMKALQLLVDDLRNRIERSGGSPALERVVSVLDRVDLRLGDNDPFRGQRRNSATLELSKRWYLSASYDDEGNTRGTIIYSIRFR